MAVFFVVGGLVAFLLVVALLVLRKVRVRSTKRPKEVFYDFRLTSYDDSRDDTGKTKALVTGGCGSLGKELTTQLVASGKYLVHSLDLFIPPDSKRVRGVYMYIQADVTSHNHMERALDGMDVVFHTAALIPTTVRNTPQEMRRVNLEGTKVVLEACKKHAVKRLVYTSSITVVLDKDLHRNYEEVDDMFPLPKQPLNEYVRSKGEAEMLVREAHGENGLRTCALRLGTLINPNSMEVWLIGNSIKQLGEGNWSMSYIVVDSAAELHILADRYLAKKPLTPQNNVFQAVSGAVNYREWMNFISSEDNGRKIVKIPVWLCKGLAFLNEAAFKLTGSAPFGEKTASMTLDFLVSCTASMERTERELGWAEKRPWQEVMRLLIAEYRYTVNQ